MCNILAEVAIVLAYIKKTTKKIRGSHPYHLRYIYDMYTKFHKNWSNQDFVTNNFIREFYILNNNYEGRVYLPIIRVLLFV